MPGFDFKQENQTQSQAKAESASDKAEQQTNARRAARDQGSKNYSSISSAYRRRNNRLGNNGDLDSVYQGLKNALEGSPELEKEVQLVPVSSDSLRYPAVAIVGKEFEHDGTKNVSYFYFPVQDRSTPLEKRAMDSRRDDDVIVPPTPTDVIDGKFEDGVESAIRQQLKLDDSVQLHCAGQQIIGELFELEHKDNSRGYSELIYAADGQIYTCSLEVIQDYSATISANVIADGTVVVARVDYTPSIATDLVNNPITSHFNIQLTERRKRERGNRDERRDDSYNNEAGLGTKLIELDGIVNFIFADDDGDDRYDRRRDDRPQKFIPELRINAINVRLNPTIGNFIYGLSAVAAVAANDRWVQCFSPKVIRKQPSRNLGGLYVEQPERDKDAVPEDLSEETIDGVYEFARYACDPNVMITLMAPETSEYSRISDHFYQMASAKLGSDEYMELYDVLMEHLSQLLGGREFDWDPEEPIVSSDMLHRMLNGYYQDGTEVRSIEDVDYLSIINQEGRHSLEMAQDWDQSYALENYDDGTKKRAAIQSEELDSMVRYTGASTTITFTMAFLNAVNEQCGKVGLGISTDSIEDNSGRKARRTSSQLRDYAGKASRRDSYRNDDRRSRRGGRRGR